MQINADVLRAHLTRLAACLLIVAAYAFARPAALPETERARLAAEFGFSQAPLPELGGRARRYVRTVNPAFRNFAQWISAVGAAVALNDLDGDGLPNDVCYVDTRVDLVTVAPVPGTPARYEPFALEPNPLPYDAETTAPMGCLPGDLNEDGAMDVLVYYWGRTPIAFLKRQPQDAADRSLTSGSYVRSEVVAGGECWFTNAATLADLDGDGHTDLIIGNYFPDGARVLDARATTREQMQDSMSLAFNGGHDRLLLWKKPTAPGSEGSVRYEDVRGVLDERVARGWTLAVGASDLDGDLLPEIYLAHDFGPDRLLHNRSEPGRLRFTLLEGTRTFFMPKSRVLGHDSYKGMGVDFGDLNGDGWPDIYVSNIAAEYALEESHFMFISTGQTARMKQGVAPYVDDGERLGVSRSGWGWETRLGDFNNDGTLEALQATGFMKGSTNRWPELHELAMSNDQLLRRPQSWPQFQPDDDVSGHDRNHFFVRARDGRYYDLAPDLGINRSDVGRGIATADVDGDGRLDFAVANQWNTAYFFHNEGRGAGKFLGLRLRLPLADGAPSKTKLCGQGRSPAWQGRPAVGAQAKVFVDGRAPLVSQVDGGNGHSGKRSPDLQFGLSGFPNDKRVTVELRWREAGGRARLETLEVIPNSWYTVLLGQEGGAIDECE